MTEASPPVATSKTETPRGFYVPALQPNTPRARYHGSVQELVAKVAREANDEHPAPFKLTKLNEANERLVATHDIIRAMSYDRKAGAQRPVLWVDGPLDLGLTVLALRHREKGTRAIPHVQAYVKDPTTHRSWEKARDLVASLPKELSGTRSKALHDRPNGRFYPAKFTGEGALAKFYEGKYAENFALLPTESQTWAERATPSPTLVERVGRLTPLQALLANTQEYPLRFINGGWGRGRHEGTSLLTAARARVGDQRADVTAVLCGLLTEIQKEALSSNRSVPGDLHRFFNLNSAAQLARLLFVQRLIRETSLAGSNWTDPDREALLRVFFGITAQVSLSTLDVLCHAPSTFVEEASAFTLQNVEELLEKPTVRWDDGTELYLYDGVELNPQLVRDTVKQPGKLLEVRNVEQRRILLRLVGTDALLADVKAKQLAEDDFGQLFSLPNGSQFVVVNNATPEPDGSIRKYVLGTVGNSHQSARSGVASTWGLRAEQYWPTRET